MIETYKGCEEPLPVQTNPIVRQHVPYSSTKFVFGFNYFQRKRNEEGQVYL
jgi:hypothetical protein